MRGNLEESRWPTRKSPKNKEMFWIAYMDRPRVGGVQLVDWCTCQPTHRALRTGSCSRLHPWMGHAWEVFDWCIFGPTHIALKTRSCSGLNLKQKITGKKILVLLSALIERFGVSRTRFFFLILFKFFYYNCTKMLRNVLYIHYITAIISAVPNEDLLTQNCVMCLV